MNLANEIQRLIRDELGRTVFTAIVSGIDDARVEITRIGQDSADPVSYPRLASYASPQVGDRVLVVNIRETSDVDRLVVVGVIDS